MYLSLDGSATVYVNTSIPALNALRGTSFDPSPNARASTATPSAPSFRRRTPAWSGCARRAAATAGSSTCGSTSTTCARLSEAAPFAWSTYQFKRDGDLFVYRQTVGAVRRQAIRAASDWNGGELVAVPPAPAEQDPLPQHSRDIGRGNILVWEQPLADRLRGEPLELDARMEPQSILYRTLWLFGVDVRRRRGGLRARYRLGDEAGCGAAGRAALETRPG